MKTKTYLFFVLFFASSALLAQDYAFKVLATKGPNEYKTAGAWQPLKTGAALKTGDEVRLADNSYLGLVSSEGKPMELKEAKIYKVAELSAKVAGAGTSVVEKYTDFILSSNSAEGKKNRLNATGAVHRGEADASLIKLVLPDMPAISFFGNDILVRWTGADVQGPFVVTLKNMFEEDIKTIDTQETFCRIDFSDPAVAKEGAVFVEVRSKSNNKVVSKQQNLKRLSASELTNVKKAYDELYPAVSEVTALNKFIIAGFFEQNKLIPDAITAYEEAVLLAPDVPEYKDAYDEFLQRQGIKK